MFFEWHPRLIFYFSCHIILYWEKVSPYEKLSHSPNIEVRLSGQFQRFNAIDGSIKKLEDSWIYKNSKWKIVKHFTRLKQRVTLRKLSSLPSTHPPPDKILLRLWNKNFLTEIYRNIQTFPFKVLQESSSWASINGAVQIFFLTSKRNLFAGKFADSERFLAVLREHIIFNAKWVKVHKMIEIFLRNLYCKMNDLFSLVFVGC